MDKERLEQIFKKHQYVLCKRLMNFGDIHVDLDRPSELRWVDLTLAMYAGKEYDLWKKLYFRFERPKKPKKPTTGMF